MYRLLCASLVCLLSVSSAEASDLGPLAPYQARTGAAAIALIEACGTGECQLRAGEAEYMNALSVEGWRDPSDGSEIRSWNHFAQVLRDYGDERACTPRRRYWGVTNTGEMRSDGRVRDCYPGEKHLCIGERCISLYCMNPDDDWQPLVAPPPEKLRVSVPLAQMVCGPEVVAPGTYFQGTVVPYVGFTEQFGVAVPTAPYAGAMNSRTCTTVGVGTSN